MSDSASSHGEEGKVASPSGPVQVDLKDTNARAIEHSIDASFDTLVQKSRERLQHSIKNAEDSQQARFKKIKDDMKVTLAGLVANQIEEEASIEQARKELKQGHKVRENVPAAKLDNDPLSQNPTPDSNKVAANDPSKKTPPNDAAQGDYISCSEDNDQPSEHFYIDTTPTYHYISEPNNPTNTPSATASSTQRSEPVPPAEKSDSLPGIQPPVSSSIKRKSAGTIEEDPKRPRLDGKASSSDLMKRIFILIPSKWITPEQDKVHWISGLFRRFEPVDVTWNSLGYFVLWPDNQLGEANSSAAFHELRAKKPHGPMFDHHLVGLRLVHPGWKLHREYEPSSAPEVCNAEPVIKERRRLFLEQKAQATIKSGVIQSSGPVSGGIKGGGTQLGGIPGLYRAL